MSQRNQRIPVVAVANGRQADLRIYAYTAAEMGIPLVEARFGSSDETINLTVRQAKELGEGLLRAAAVAEGRQ